jgi:hypothetical protein
MRSGSQRRESDFSRQCAPWVEKSTQLIPLVCPLALPKTLSLSSHLRSSTDIHTHTDPSRFPGRHGSQGRRFCQPGDIKITDFSQISHLYRLQKKQLRENSEAVRSITSPVEPMPAEEQPATPSLTRVIENSANSEARPADLYREDVSSTDASPDTPTPRARSTNPPVQVQQAGSGSDFGSDGGRVSGTSTPIFDDGGFGREFVDDNDDAGEVSGPSTPVFDDGGFGREFVDEDANAE